MPSVQLGTVAVPSFNYQFRFLAYMFTRDSLALAQYKR